MGKKRKKSSFHNIKIGEILIPYKTNNQKAIEQRKKNIQN